LGLTVLIIVVLIICHWLRVLRIRRVHLPLVNVSLASPPPSSTISPSVRLVRSLSDSTLNYHLSPISVPSASTISSPISVPSASSTTPDLLPPHRYPTRLQKRLNYI